MEIMERSFSFTARGLNRMLETVDDPVFREQDAEKIIAALRDQMRVVPFCEYLKRYVYLRSGMVGSYRDVSPEEYRDTVCDAFYATGTPASMKHLSTRVSTRVAGWLQQGKVRRSVVLLLGFGLSMSREDVNEFLTKALHEHQLDEDDPLEAVCVYCYERHYGFLKMRQLMQVLEDAEAGRPIHALIEQNQPAGREASREVAAADERLILEILERKKEPGLKGQRKRTLRHFEDLYRQAERITGPEQPSEEPAEAGGAERKGKKLSGIENVLYASVPRERHGNLLAEINSSLLEVIAGKRLSRQRLSRLINGEEEPSRYDLMTLNFLIFAKEQSFRDPKEKAFRFMEDTNGILRDCGYGELYPADPYECFLIMCMLSVDPLGTFGDVLEMSYEEGSGAEGGEDDA